MSSSRGLLSGLARAGLLAAALIGLGAVAAGCSFSPVYGEAQAVSSYALRFPAPHNRLSQIIYQDLALHFATDDPAAPELRVITSARAAGITRTVKTGPYNNYEMTVTAAVRLVDKDGKALLDTTRFASAAYTSSGQVLADRAAVAEAEERAARSLAQTIRLSVLAALSGR